MQYSSTGALRLVIIGILVVCPLGLAGALSLEEAESLAVARDAGVAGIEERSAALSESAVADEQLPDPELRFGAVNLPVDSFSLDDENMTQILVGLRQRIPRGKTRSLRREQTETMAAAEFEMAEERRREVVRAVRSAWIERAFVERAIAIVERQQSWFLQLEDAATAAYASGGRRQHELFRIAMERELLEEDKERLRQMGRSWDAELGRWLGPQADAANPSDIPELPSLPPKQMATVTLAGHPTLTAQTRRAEAGKVGVDLAKQQSRPNWAIDVSYGFRQGEDRAGDDRPDFFSAMLSFEMPIFPKNRQDRRVSAAMATELEMKSLLRDRQRIIRRSFESAWADENVLEQRIDLFENRVLPSALANVEATRQAYRNDVVLFDELVRSEKSLLDSRMRLLRLRADHALSTAELLYLTGVSR